MGEQGQKDDAMKDQGGDEPAIGAKFNTLRVDTRYGHMVIPDPSQDIIGKHLSEHGEWAEFETQFLSNLIKDGARVTDIGAFIGTFGLSMQNKRKSLKLIFVEANPEIIPLLEENVKRNCHTDYIVIEALIGPQEFRTPGLRDVHNLGSSSFLASSPDPGKVSVPMPQRQWTLRQLQRKYGPFDLIKLDTEGMELPILADEIEIIKQNSTNLWIECNEQERNLDLAEFLLSTGRDVYYFAFPSFNPGNFHHNQKPIFPFAYEAGMLVSSVEPYLPPALTDAGCILCKINSKEDLNDVLLRTPRWAPREWWNLTREQVVGLVTHDIEKLHIALATAHSRLEERKQYMIARESQLRCAEQARRRAEVLAAERLAAIEAEKIARQGIELIAAHRLALLCAERDLRKEADDARMIAEALHAAALRDHQAAEEMIAAIMSSTTWRVTSPLRALLSQTPRIRRLIRLFAGAARRLRRRRPANSNSP